MRATRKSLSLKDLHSESVAAEALRRKLPRGSSSLPKEVAQQTQRIRLFHGLAGAIVEKGYVGITLTDITRHAGVSRTTFYELFTDKEHCFLEGIRAMAGVHLGSVGKAMADAPHLADQCSRALAAYIERVDAHPTLAAAFIAEAESASPAVRAALEAAQAQWTVMIQAWIKLVRKAYPEVAAPSEQTVQMLVAGLRNFAALRARHGPGKRDDGVTELTRFTFASLGLYGWARKAGTSPRQWGSPLR